MGCGEGRDPPGRPLCPASPPPQGCLDLPIVPQRRGGALSKEHLLLSFELALLWLGMGTAGPEGPGKCHGDMMALLCMCTWCVIV